MGFHRLCCEWCLYKDRGKPCLPFPCNFCPPHSSWLNIGWGSEFPCSWPMDKSHKCSSGLSSDLKPRDLGLNLTFIINAAWPWRSPFVSLRLGYLLCKNGDALSPFRFLLIMLRTQLCVSTQHQPSLHAVCSLPPQLLEDTGGRGRKWSGMQAGSFALPVLLLGSDPEPPRHFFQHLVITMVFYFDAVLGEDWSQLIGSWHIVYIPSTDIC